MLTYNVVTLPNNNHPMTTKIEKNNEKNEKNKAIDLAIAQIEKSF